MQMTCPKCRGEMRTYERSGVTIDQCTECRGIFLDRGELEKLFDAEANWNRSQAAPPAAAAPPRPQPPGGYAPPPAAPGHGGGYAPPPPAYGQPAAHGYPAPAPAYGAPGGYHGHYRARGHHGHYQHKRRKSFLNELFD
ncbi:MAG TPA: zf-TFIIB domain-containing protein [Actinoplanes sp.]|nr:zf-TFIIB domain-containing protein [Actinoplanes sp.]